MGPWGGFVTGLAETIEYVFTTGVIVLFSAGYLNSIIATLTGFDLAGAGYLWVWWVVLYAVFIALNAAGASISFRFAVVVSILSIGILVLFGIARLRERRRRLLEAVGHRARRVGRRQFAVPALRLVGHPVRAPVRDVVLPRHRGAAPRGRGGPRSLEGHPARGDLGARHPHRHGLPSCCSSTRP